ncbi:metallophosphoesterase [Methylobacterium soli]|uniref:Metallophosphoesterase n=1 Tax=Methylobacterium soli TaxID=553447 RepID=A0A6L3T9T0_9HYPH|nr:metallophosphoesterase [Methylobacterium soli]KAB1080555.1 metallophosphoesterase [Methylobacterium soli]GJE45423.1 hypothetical protein AEGHOMDF_4618 [Methylobacterium soli]
MKLWILSDLHRDVGSPWQPPAVPEADVAVVAGDVGEGLAASVAWLAQAIRPHMPVVFVAGNHEFYRSCHPDELRRGRTAARDQDIHLLENEIVTINGVTFLGCTLWTDYGLDGERWRADAMEKAVHGLTDHRLIAWRREPSWRPFRPEQAAALHRESREFLRFALTGRLGLPGDRPHVVVSHHAPSARSIASRFIGDPLNPCFASRLDGLVATVAPGLWVHGHTHTSFDYFIGSTRVVCNPKGYGAENPAFDPALVVEVPRDLV